MLEINLLQITIKFNLIEAVQILFGDELNMLLQMQTHSLLIFV